MSRRTFLKSLALLACAALTDDAMAHDEIVVIVNPELGLKTVDAAELKAIFTARREFWPSGQSVIALNFPAKHQTRVAFDHAVLHMNAEEVARYWIDRRIRGGNRPPRTAPDATTIVRVVERLPGAIAYAPASAMSREVKLVARVKGGQVFPEK